MMKQIDQTIRALKDPEYREAVGNGVVHPSGEVSNDELKAVVGGSDVSPETTLPCTVIAFSMVKC
ncbi:class II lanthipeptide, LchA2/BrtA2 family [Bacillus manliponensis]|uniref:class II lanthipeptide, LchA2/BrtA2 family n=1 Tax=Bacillus manliponensis TaxID=574376 RepID=UPI003516676E